MEDRLLEDLTYSEEAPVGWEPASSILARAGGHLLLWTIAAAVCYAAAL